MTVRDFVQKILLESPDLDADIYILEKLDAPDTYNSFNDYEIKSISNDGANDGLFIQIKRWKPHYDN